MASPKARTHRKKPVPQPPTPEQIERLQTTRALVALARLALDECARAGHISDDRPEMILSTVARWCIGEASWADVMQAKRETYDPENRDANGQPHRGKPGSRLPKPHHVALELARMAAWTAADYAIGSSLYRNSRPPEAWGLVARCLAECGEERMAARARVEQTWERWMGEGAVERSGITRQGGLV